MNVSASTVRTSTTAPLYLSAGSIEMDARVQDVALITLARDDS